ncbi:hydrogenase maturation protease, partial [bacterium]|nr:hydrogenase maturation protease [bacterium]
MSDYADVLVLGVGNTLMGDEGIGVYVIRELEKEKLSGNIELIDAGTALFSIVHLLRKRK